MELNKYLTDLFVRKAGEAPLTDTPAPPAAVTPPPAQPPAAAIPVTPRSDPDEVFRDAKKRIHTQIVDRLKPGDLDLVPDDRRRAELRTALERMVETARTRSP
jgi:hypothetical protein